MNDARAVEIRGCRFRRSAVTISPLPAAMRMTGACRDVRIGDR
jgi:hypothetical protein